MRALVMTETAAPLEVGDVSDPTLHDDGIIVETRANGICRSDWHLWQGEWEWLGMSMEVPWVFGHEFAGVVTEVGKDTRGFAVGDRVFVPHVHGCGHCEDCRSGFPNVCMSLLAGISYWGGFGQYVSVPAADRNVVALPDNVGFEAAAGLGCRFMTAWHGIVDQAKVKPGEWVVVAGSGGLGLSAIQIAAKSGASVIATDINAKALDLAKEAGATHVVNSREESHIEEIRELTGGGAHVSVDALGLRQTCQASIATLRKRGRHLQAGLTSKEEAGFISLPVDVIALQELQVIGVANMPISRAPDMLRMVENRVIDPGALITQTVGLEGARDIMHAMGTFNTPGIAVINDWS